MKMRLTEDIRDRLYNSPRGEFPDFYISAEDELYLNNDQRVAAMKFPEHARYGRWGTPPDTSKTL